MCLKQIRPEGWAFVIRDSDHSQPLARSALPFIENRLIMVVIDAIDRLLLISTLIS